MTFNPSMTGKWKALKLAAAAAVIGLPMMTASAQQLRGYGEVEPQAAATPQTWSSAQSNLDRDRNDLIGARRRADDLAAQRDQQQRIVDSIRNGGTAPSTAAPSTATTGDVKALQQQFDDAKAKADKLHDDAVARFEQSDAWKSEFARFDQARKDLKGPTDAVLNQASQGRDFQDLVNAAKAAKERADKLHDDKNADPKTVREADDAFVAADNRVQEAAEQALKADPHVADLRKTVDASKAHLDEMRDKFEQDLINDPQFGPAVADVRARQSALDAATGHTTPTDPQLATGSVPTGPGAMRDAQARLDQLNRDLDDARAEVDRLTARVRDDEQAMGVADSTTPQQQQQQQQAPPSGDYQPQAPDYGYGAPPPPQADGGYGYGGDYGYGAEPAPYAVPVYAPAVVAQPYDWWSPYLSFGISVGSYHYHNYWCNDWYGRWCGPAYYGHSHGYYGYSGGHGHYYDHGYYSHGHDSGHGSGSYGHGGYAYGSAGHHSGYGYSTYGRGYGSYAYGGGNYGRANRGGAYYEGARYGRGSGSTYGSTGSYAYRGGASAGRSSSYYGSASNYAGRSASRYESPLAAGRQSSAYADRYTGRSNYSTARDSSAYRDRVERRSNEALARPQADRSAYESRVQRRSAESFAAPRASRGAQSTPSYRYQLSSPHATRSYAESRHSSAPSASPRVESSRSYGSGSRGGSESHHSSSSSGNSSSGREGGGGDHSGSSSHSSRSGHSR